MSNPQKAIQLSNELSKVTDDLRIILTKYDAHTNLWDVAMRQKDGLEETKQREILHTLVDQLLDCRARSVHLTDQFKRNL